jgi:BirA family transcriptional regulator, biotin operon repressor / biotin---[acetyl-CoA-carboxylase] ligase
MLGLAAAGAAEGDWLITDAQTAGRGRMGRSWDSPIGNLYASGLVRLRPGDPDAATLALVAAVAVHDAVAIWAPAIQLKWPNDVLSANGEKLSGILLERAADAIVIGVGVNLTHHPVGLDRPVTSIAKMGVVPPDSMAFLETLAEIFARWVSTWRGVELSAIRTAWLERAHPVGTALVANLPEGESVEGLFDGLTAACALRLRLADGAVRVIHAGDVFLI